jgi:hypothetical protein
MFLSPNKSTEISVVNYVLLHFLTMPFLEKSLQKSHLLSIFRSNTSYSTVHLTMKIQADYKQRARDEALSKPRKCRPPRCVSVCFYNQILKISILRVIK